MKIKKIFILIFIILTCISFYLYKSINKDCVYVSAKRLAKDYESNIANADYKYLNKKIKVNGNIFTIGKIIISGYHVTFKVNNSYINCIFKNNKRKMLSSLREKSKVTIQGKCKGLQNCGVVIDNCVILNKEEK